MVKNTKTLRGLYSKKNKWCQNKWTTRQNGESQFCLLAAIQYLYKSVTASNEVHNKLLKAIAKLTHKSIKTVSLSAFNDHPRTDITRIRQVVRMANV